jgi:hypothetical protein
MEGVCMPREQHANRISNLFMIFYFFDQFGPGAPVIALDALKPTRTNSVRESIPSSKPR